MEYVIFVAALVGVLAILMLMGYLDYKREEKRFIRRLYEEYGVLPQREYKWEEFQNISHYFLKVFMWMISHGMTLIWTNCLCR